MPRPTLRGMASLLVHYGNVYIGNPRPLRALRQLRKGKPDVIVITEGGRIHRLLARFARRYRVHITPHGKGDRRGRTDVIVLVRKKHKKIGRRRLAIWLSRGMRRIPSNHDRFAVVAKFHHDELGKVAVVGVHPSPGPKALAGDGSHPIAKQYNRAMLRISLLIRTLERDGFMVVVAGDVQIKESAPDKPWDPYLMLEDAGLRIDTTAHLDVIASSKDLDDVESGVLATAGAYGNDHPWLFGRYKHRPRRRRD